MPTYDQNAKALWGETPAYKEYEKKSIHRTSEEDKILGEQLMTIFADLGKLKALPPEEKNVQRKIEELQTFITEHYYTCTDEILLGLAGLYTVGDTMMENIDTAGGPGTAACTAAAVRTRLPSTIRFGTI